MPDGLLVKERDASKMSCSVGMLAYQVEGVGKERDTFSMPCSCYDLSLLAYWEGLVRGREPSSMPCPVLLHLVSTMCLGTVQVNLLAKLGLNGNPVWEYGIRACIPNGQFMSCVPSIVPGIAYILLVQSWLECALIYICSRSLNSVVFKAAISSISWDFDWHEWVCILATEWKEDVCSCKDTFFDTVLS